MIGRNIIKGIGVFHEVYGYGVFLEYCQGNVSDFAVIQYEGRIRKLHRKELTEIDEEEK